jgi:hypothetical protein
MIRRNTVHVAPGDRFLIESKAAQTKPKAFKDTVANKLLSCEIDARFWDEMIGRV